MGHKGHIMVKKGLKMHKKKAKNRVFGPKKKVFFLSGIGGYPPPLTENQCEKKKDFFLSGKGGYPPPLNGRIPLKRF